MALLVRDSMHFNYIPLLPRLTMDTQAMELPMTQLPSTVL